MTSTRAKGKEIEELKESHDYFGLIHATKDEHAKVRKRAVEALLELIKEGRTESVLNAGGDSRIVELVSDKNEEVREVVKKALMELGDSYFKDSIVPLLMEVLDNGSSLERQEILKTVGWMAEEGKSLMIVDSEAIRRISMQLHHDEPRIRSLALSTMRKIIEHGGDERALERSFMEEIPEMLSDDDPKVQEEIARLIGSIAGLGHVGKVVNEGTIKILLNNVVYGNEDVQFASGYALKVIAEGGGVREIVEAGGFPVLVKMVRYGEWDISSDVIQSLDEMHHPEADLLVKEIVDRKGRDLERDTFRDVYELLRDPSYETNYEKTMRKASERSKENEITGRVEELENGDTREGENDVRGEKQEKSIVKRERDKRGENWEESNVKREREKREEEYEKGAEEREEGEVVGEGRREQRNEDGEGLSWKEDIKLVFSLFWYLLSWPVRRKEKPGPRVREQYSEDIPGLVEALGSSDESEVLEALEGLTWVARWGWVGKIIEVKGISEILGVLERGDGDAVQERAEEAMMEISKEIILWNVEDTNAIEQFTQAFGSSSLRVRKLSLDFLVKLVREGGEWKLVKKRAIVQLIELLDDKDPGIRLRTVMLLGELGSSRAIKHLRSIMEKETDVRIRKAAVESIEKLS